MGRHGAGWGEGRHGMRQEGERLETQNPCLPSIGPSLPPEGSCPGDMVHPLAHKPLGTLSSYRVTGTKSVGNPSTLFPHPVGRHFSWFFHTVLFSSDFMLLTYLLSPKLWIL